MGTPVVLVHCLLTLLFASLNMINIGLEEVYNPRLRGVTGE